MMEKTPIFLMFKNQKFWTLKSLDFLIENTNEEDYNLVLIDNGSDLVVHDFIKEYLNKKLKSYEMVHFKDNVGVSYAYMQAINQFAKDSDSFVILHNDVFVTKDWLKNLKSHKEKIEKSGDIKWSCIYPRTNYCTENTPTKYDAELNSLFIENKLSSKAFYWAEDIEENLKKIYSSFDGLEKYSKKVYDENKNYFKITEEFCCFATLFNKKLFFDLDGLDLDFTRRRSECKIFNDKCIYKNYYPILAMDVFVHHHGNLTTDGPSMSFSFDFNESEKIYNKKREKFYFEKREEEKFITSLMKGTNMVFIRDGGIGDIIMSMFSLQALKDKFPNVKITYMTRDIYMSFVSGFSCIDEVLPINLQYDYSYANRDRVENEEKISLLKERYDYVKNWIKYVEYHDKRDIHRILKFLNSIEIEGLVPVLPKYNIDLYAQRKIDMLFGELKSEKIVVCMDATCDIRSIPSDVGYEIIDMESKKGKKVFLIGNSKELDLEGFEAKENIFDIGMSLNVEEIPALIRKCSYVYTPDTGIFHIASLLGVPSKAFFGSIDPSLRDGGYYGVKNTIFYKKGILPCVPCRDLGCKEIPCMKYTKQEIERIVDGKC